MQRELDRLTGVLFMQVYIYQRLFPKDPMYYKLTVRGSYSASNGILTIEYMVQVLVLWYYILLKLSAGYYSHRGRILDMTQTVAACIVDWQTIVTQTAHGEDIERMDQIPG